MKTFPDHRCFRKDVCVLVTPCQHNSNKCRLQYFGRRSNFPVLCTTRFYILTFILLIQNLKNSSVKALLKTYNVFCSRSPIVLHVIIFRLACVFISLEIILLDSFQAWLQKFRLANKNLNFEANLYRNLPEIGTSP